MRPFPHRVALFSGLLLLVTAMWAACNYTPHKQATFIPGHISRVYIFNFLNRSKNREIAVKLVRELERVLDTNQEMGSTADLEKADAIIEGTITRLFFQPLTHTRLGDIDKARYYLETVFSFKDIKKQKYLLKDETLGVVRIVNLHSQPVSDLVQSLDDMLEESAKKITQFCTTGIRPDMNAMYGYEDKPQIEDDGTIIGGQRKNYDRNNDGIDDRYQSLTNSDGLTNINRRD